MIRPEEVRLPELSPDATEADRRLLQALYEQFRDVGARLGALEATLGTVPRRMSSTITAMPTLTATYIGYGSSANALTGSSKFTWNNTTNTLTGGAADDSINIKGIAAAASADAAGSGVFVTGGAGDSSGDGGEAQLNGGAGGATGGGGGIYIAGGAGGATSGNGGLISFRGGNAQTSGSGGGATFTGGDGVGANPGGGVTLNGGAGGSGGDGGDVTLRPGLGTSGGANGKIIVYTEIEGREQTAPGAAPTNGYRLFAQDNGAGKTQLMVIFSSGAAQQIAIQP